MTRDSTVVRLGRRTVGGEQGAHKTPVTLDAFGVRVAAASGISLAELSPLEELEVLTRNSCYHITVIDSHTSRILVRGGAYFPISSEVRLGGASLGGSMLKLGWIGHGFCLELHDSHQHIVTTPVREIRRVEPRACC